MVPYLRNADSTFFEDVPGTLSDDPNYLNDANPPNTYTGPIFGIDIAPGTSVGAYIITVDVLAPEPAAGDAALGGLAALAAWHGFRRKWRGMQTSWRIIWCSRMKRRCRVRCEEAPGSKRNFPEPDQGIRKGVPCGTSIRSAG